MVAVGGSGLPPSLLGGQRFGRGRPVIRLLHGDWHAQRGQPRLVAQQVAHRDLPLARSRELRPVLRHRLVDVELALLDQAMGADRRHALGRGIDVDDRVLLPGAGPRLVSEASPQLHHGLAVEVDRNPSSQLAMLLEVAHKRLAHSRKTLVALTLHLDRRCHIESPIDRDPSSEPT